MKPKKTILKMSRSKQIELAFELKNEGHTVAEIAKKIGVSTRSIFKWFSKNKPTKANIEAPETFEEALELLSKVTANEITIAMSISKSGRGASDRVYRLAKTLNIIKILSDQNNSKPTAKSADQLEEIRSKVIKRAVEISKASKEV